MWRFVLFIGFFCSIGLNVYLFVQLNVRTIENTLLTNNQPQSTLNTKQAIEIVNLKADIAPNLHEPISTEKLADKIKIAINSRDFFLAGFLINSLAKDNANKLPEARDYWLQATQTLINEGLFNYVENSVSAYLAFQPDDIAFLYLQVDSYLQQKLLLSAIKYAYEIQYHVFNEAKKRDVIFYARQLVQQQVDFFIKNNLWLELRELTEQVSLFDPEDLSLQWLFGQAQYQLGELEQARNAIEPLLIEPNYTVKTQTLLAKINAALRKPESIPLNKQGEHFIVQATINNGFNVSLMLDTGASISLLSEQAFEQLSQYEAVNYVEDLQLNTAGGQVTASIYQVEEFELQGYVLKNFIFAVSPFISDNTDGLLGMNYLSAFDFHIDQTNNLLILANK